MKKRLRASELPCATLFWLLPDEQLELVESDAERSVYSYLCGCTAVRPNDSEDCNITWCTTHEPRIQSV